MTEDQERLSQRGLSFVTGDDGEEIKDEDGNRQESFDYDEQNKKDKQQRLI